MRSVTYRYFLGRKLSERSCLSKEDGLCTLEFPGESKSLPLDLAQALDTCLRTGQACKLH